MSNYLQTLEALHGDMIAALLGRRTEAPLVLPTSAPAPVAVEPVPAKAKPLPGVALPGITTCSICGKRLRVDSVGGMCGKCRETRLLKSCQSCGTPLRGANVSGYCRSCGIRRALDAKQIAAAVEPEPVEAAAPIVPEPEPEPAIRTGSFVRIISGRYAHPFRYGTVGRVVEITRQSAMNWIKVRVGSAWHNFPESELELVEG